MCVKFEYYSSKPQEFNLKTPLKDQIYNLKSININYKKAADKKEIEILIEQLLTALKLDILTPFDLNFNCNNLLSGAKLARELKRIEKNNKRAYAVSQTIAMHLKLVKSLDTIIKQIKKV